LSAVVNSTGGEFRWADFDRVQINALGDRDNIVIYQPQLSQPVTIDAGAGDDAVDVDHAAITLNGGAGNDSLNARESDWIFHGGTGVDSVTDYHFDPFGIDLRTMPTTENASMKLGDN